MNLSETYQEKKESTQKNKKKQNEWSRISMQKHRLNKKSNIGMIQLIM